MTCWKGCFDCLEPVFGDAVEEVEELEEEEEEAVDPWTLYEGKDLYG